MATSNKGGGSILKMNKPDKIGIITTPMGIDCTGLSDCTGRSE